MTEPDATADGRTDSENRPDSSKALPLRRRALVRAAGVGAVAAGGIGAWGTAAAADDETTEDDHEADDEHRRDDDETNQPPSADPVFGFASISPEVKPPVEPDHVVELLVRPAEGREIPEFFYDPCGLYVEPGDTVKFSYTTPHHTITASTRRAGRRGASPRASRRSPRPCSTPARTGSTRSRYRACTTSTAVRTRRSVT